MEATQIAPEAQSNTFGQKSLKLVKSRPACACYQTPPDFPHGLLEIWNETLSAVSLTTG
jgi:hypothetical protein